MILEDPCRKATSQIIEGGIRFLLVLIWDFKYFKLEQMNHSFEDEISEHPFDPFELQALQMGQGHATVGKSKRGPIRIPEQWTRVISISHDNLQHIRLVSIETDIAIMQNIEIGNDQQEEGGW